MADISSRLCLLLLVVVSIFGVVEGWSTTITQRCITQTTLPSGQTSPTTTTRTRTRYSAYISSVTTTTTISSTAARSTTTITNSGTVTVHVITGTTSYPVTWYGYDIEQSYVMETTTVTVHRTVTAGVTTITKPTPRGFTPAASNKIPTTNGIAPALLAQASGNVICRDIYILYTTDTTTITAFSTTVITASTSVRTLTSNDKTYTTEYDVASQPYYIIDYTSTKTYPFYTLYLGTTTTTTTTTIIPTTTYHAACAPNNLLTSVGNGDYDSIVGFSSRDTPLTTDADDAYSCCVLCMTSRNCTGSFYAPYGYTYYDPYGPEDFTCFLFFVEVDAKCRPARTAGWVYHVYEGYGLPAYASNGQCGQGYLANGID